MKARLGSPSAITATAHKLARLIYRLLKHGELYVRQGLEVYEEKHRQRLLQHLHKTALNLGFQLTPNTPAASVVSLQGASGASIAGGSPGGQEIHLGGHGR